MTQLKVRYVNQIVFPARKFFSEAVDSHAEEVCAGTVCCSVCEGAVMGEVFGSTVCIPANTDLLQIKLEYVFD